jgi:hypothetical protein
MEFVGASIFIMYSIFTAVQLERQRKELNIDRRSVHKQLNEQLKLDKEIAAELQVKPKGIDWAALLPLAVQYMGKQGKGVDDADVAALISNFEKGDK